MHNETGQYAEQVRCPHCGSSFPVELRKMRSGFPSFCPSCKRHCTISEDEAIRAQRLLEEVERGRRTAPAPYRPSTGAADVDMTPRFG